LLNLAFQVVQHKAHCVPVDITNWFNTL